MALAATGRRLRKRASCGVSISGPRGRSDGSHPTGNVRVRGRGRGAPRARSQDQTGVVRTIDHATDARRAGQSYGPRVRLWSLLRRRAGDAFVVGLLIGAQVEIWVADLEGSKAVLVLFGLLWTAPLFLRRRFPLVAPVLPFAAVATETFFAAQGVNGAIMSISAAIFAAWSLGVGNERRRALAGTAVCWACGAIINRNFGATGVGDFVFITLLVAAPVTAGQLLRAR